MRPTSRRTPRRRPTALLGVLLGVVLVASGCSGVYRYNVTLPDVPTSAQSSQIYDANGTLITTLHGEQNREIVTLDQISPTLLCAVVAIEDERFWEHAGVDIRGLARAFVRNAEAGEVVEGGSTITQQLVEVTYRDPEAQEAGGKAREIIRALQLEQEFDKDTILGRYLNIVYFGSSAYGAEAASEQYFDHPASELTWGEAALLAGLIQAPSRLDPYRNPAGAQERRQLVLDNMLRISEEGGTPHCAMDRAAYDAAREEPVAPVVRAEYQYRAGHYVEAVKRWFLYDEDFGRFLEQNGYTNTLDAREQLMLEGGLRLDTAIDLNLQSVAEQAVAAVLPPDRTDWPIAAMTVVDPTNGHVIAMVGGPDFWDASRSYAQYDFASVGRRQTGSSFKPFVLAAGLENGTFVPGTRVDAPTEAQIDLGNGTVWKPRNADGSGRGMMSVEDATVNSVNTAYANLMVQVGPQAAIDTAADLGVMSPMQPYYSAVLGTNELTTLDMASAYATFATRGIHHSPVFVTRITLTNGAVLYEATGDPTKAGERVLSERVADTVNGILEQVVERGTAAQNGPLPDDRPAAGKTGSTNDLRNAYFVGYTPQMVAAVWVGYPGEYKPMTPPTVPIRVFGGTWPTMIWNGFMSAAMVNRPVLEFAPMPTWVTPTTAATAPVPRTVPDVTGKPIGEAREILHQAGFRETTTEELSSAPAGTVLRQDPPGGSRLSTSIPVTLVLAGAPDSSLPSVVGLPQASAEATLRAGGFPVSVQAQANPAGTSGPGIVWQQDPPAGPSRPGTTVTIWVNPGETSTTTTAAPPTTTTTAAPPTSASTPPPTEPPPAPSTSASSAPPP